MGYNEKNCGGGCGAFLIRGEWAVIGLSWQLKAAAVPPAPPLQLIHLFMQFFADRQTDRQTDSRTVNVIRNSSGAKCRLPESIIVWVGGMNHISQLLYGIFSEQSHDITWTSAARNTLQHPQMAFNYIPPWFLLQNADKLVAFITFALSLKMFW